MLLLFEILKGMFFLTSIFVGIFYINGEIIAGSNYETIKAYLMPGYMILCGLMIGYFIATIRTYQFEEGEEISYTKIYVRSFTIGIIFGILLSLSYIFYVS